MHKRWSEDEIKHAVELLEVGKNFKEIGSVLGKSGNSVKRKMNGWGHYYLNHNITIKTVSCLNCSNTIELEHIDGNSENNSLDNLKILCPNCHSLTSTYKALNSGNGRYNRRRRYKRAKVIKIKIAG